MSWKEKAFSLGSVLTLLLAFAILLNGRLVIAAQVATQSAKTQSQLVAPVEPPLTEKDLIDLVKHNKKNLQNVAAEVQARGLDFEFTPDIEKRLTKAGADENLLTDMKQYTPSARAAKAAHASGVHVSAQEAQAYNKLKGERDPDSMIKDAEAFEQQFPKSSLLTYVYAIHATAFQQKNDAADVVKYGEMSLALDPKNLMSLLLVSGDLPEPQMLNNVSDAEKEKRLDTAANDAQQALKQIDQLPKAANESDKTYQQRKDDIAAGAYAALGMVHLQLSRMALVSPDMEELAKAEENYKTAVAKSATPSPVYYYRLGEVYTGENKFDDAISAYSKAGQLAQGTVIERLADQEVQALKKAKASQPKAAAAKP